MNSIPEDEYECFTCNIRFKGRVFSITREWERVDFTKSLPVIEIADAEGLECYCSRACLEKRRDEVMAKEGVPIRYPDIGPVESCAKCAEPVDMTEFHLTYLQDESVDEGTFVSRTIDVDYLAVVCKQCHPRGISQSAYEDEAAFNVERA
ncbi:hypothetical protein [Paraburkholderia sp. Cpub6]|uniref:hypothetical protein n=1 Tax=Paraburkholderia sp. Cpub6 TaxID=2723094 RepID=UPI00161ED355|nr:hypothetical protein [Paraburkholderia sp. Cpub6]MBB5463681.1 hypothetical protein [Paraburkholderia sp. Cpub6]